MQGGVSPFACIVPGFLIAVALAVGGGLILVTCLRAAPSDSYRTRIEQLPLETPVYLSEPGIYLVRLSEGVIALDHNEPRREDVINGCFIRWREALEAEGRRGSFRSDCTGTLYDLRGMTLAGGGPPMRRHPATESDGTVTVSFKTCLDPAAGNAVVPCRPI